MKRWENLHQQLEAGRVKKPGKIKMEKSDFIFGIHTVIEAINSGKEIDRILARKVYKASFTINYRIWLRRCRFRCSWSLLKRLTELPGKITRE